MKTMQSLFWRLACLALSLSACAEFDPGSRVTTLRVLAIEADQPFARPGEDVHLQALSYEPGDRVLQWSWTSCVNPSSQSVADCLAAAEPAAKGDGPAWVQQGESSTLDFTVPKDVLKTLPVGLHAAAQVGIVTVVCPGELQPKYSNKTELPFRCIDGDSKDELGLAEFIVGIKHLRVRQSDRNANPRIARVQFDGKDWPADEIKSITACNTTGNAFSKCPAGLAHEMSAIISRDSTQHGTTEFGGTFEEQLVVQYYSTEGIFENEVKVAADPETKFVARNNARGEELQLWFVVRDDRGGVTWTERFVKVK
jgi:hypothetical protein